jgi:hypothetical protein
MITQEVDADVDPFNHVDEISLQDQRLARMVEHLSRPPKFLEVFEPEFQIIRELNKSVLDEV